MCADRDERGQATIDEHRADERDIVDVQPDAIGIVADDDVALADILDPDLLDRVADAFGHGEHEVEQAVGARAHRIVHFGRTRNGHREIIPVAQDHREGRRHQPGAHMLDDIAHPAGERRRSETIGTIEGLKFRLAKVAEWLLRQVDGAFLEAGCKHCCHDWSPSNLADVQFAILANRQKLARQHERRRRFLSNNRWPFDPVTKKQLLAAVFTGLNRLFGNVV